MIEFNIETAKSSKTIGRNIAPKGEEVLRIEFDQEDVKTDKNGTKHIDIWGPKLKALRNEII